MNRLANIYAKLLMLSMLAIIGWGCDDALDAVESGVEEGKPVEISINFSVPGMDVKSRALSEVQEYKVNDLYILILDKEGNVNSRGYFDNLVAPDHVESNAPETYGKVTMSAYSGECYIYGFANVKTNEYSDVKQMLDKVTTRAEMEAITAELASPGNIERNQAALLMSGVYKEADSASSVEEMGDGKCVVSASNGTLPGKVFLYRLDSRIRFNVSFGSNISDYKINSWRVYNVPNRSNLVPLEVDAVGNNADDYSNSMEFTDVVESASEYYFEFYMPENRKEALNPITSYAEREREHKDESGFNTGNYVNVEDYATFVEINSTFRVDDGSGTGHTILANAKYTVHLGYIGGDATDFKSKRNTKYTYNITILSIENIIVEAQEEPGSLNEPQPGAEGVITEARDELVELDAHYHTFILSFNAREMSAFDYVVKTPFNYYTSENPLPDGDPDLTWIEFKRNSRNSATVLEHHNNDGSNLLTLNDLAADVVAWKNQSYSWRPDTYELNYTVFVKEYYYEAAPHGQSWPMGTDYEKKTIWRYFVNQPDRYASLVVAPNISSDTESVYVSAKYHITQQSIQTYFSTKNIQQDGTAIGLEHVNETGVPSTTWGSPQYPSEGSSYKNGYPNTYSAVTDLSTYGTSSALWSRDFNVSSNKYRADATTRGYSIKDVIPLRECMSRNRDENGNGVYDSDEIKWYMPSVDQLVEMYIGAESMPTPLFNADAVSAITSGTSQSQYHVLSSTYSNGSALKLWAEEGASTGTWSVYGYPQEMRCIRDLGFQSNEDSFNSVSGFVFDYIEEDRVLVNTYLEERSLRQGFISDGELASHDNFSRLNLPYHGFQYSADFLVDDNGTMSTADDDIRFTGHAWEMLADGVSPCSEYYEKPDRSDLGSWRLPNQREIALMWMQDVRLVTVDDNSTGAISITNWKYQNNRYFGANNGILFLDSPGVEYNYLIRCVRDVKKRTD